MSKNVAILGSAGFIGSNLTEACLREGWTVFGVDDFSTGLKEMADPKRYSKLPGKYDFLEMTINDVTGLTEQFSKRNVETVFLLAALARVPFSIDYPLEAHAANATGHLSVLEAARKAGVKRVIFACSSSIFGGTDVYPTPETAKQHPLSPYALQKQYGAELNRLYYELHGLETINLVYYNVTGKYQTCGGAYSTIIPAFMSAAVNEERCRIDGDGTQSRDFCAVENVVQANILAARYDGKSVGGELFNIANQETHSVIEAYEIINGLAGGKVKKHYAPRRPGDPMKSMADISKAREVLGYRPMIGFRDSLEQTFGWWAGGCKTDIKK